MPVKPQLFLLHFAGGNCYSYRFLYAHLSDHFDLVAVELPGRGKRFSEPLITNRSDALNDLLRQIKAARNGNPYLVYGHSMGAALGGPICKIMEDAGDPPQHLLVSGYAAIGSVLAPRRHDLPDEEFKEDLKKLGGIPQEVFDTEELYRLFERILRADFAIHEASVYDDGPLGLTTPIYAMMGTTEEFNEKIENWGTHTSGGFQYKLLEGNHFFINDNPEELAGILRSCS